MIGFLPTELGYFCLTVGINSQSHKSELYPKVLWVEDCRFDFSIFLPLVSVPLGLALNPNMPTDLQICLWVWIAERGSSVNHFEWSYWQPKVLYVGHLILNGGQFCCQGFVLSIGCWDGQVISLTALGDVEAELGWWVSLWTKAAASVLDCQSESQSFLALPALGGWVLQGFYPFYHCNIFAIPVV